MLKVTVRLFAGYREKAGVSTLELELGDGSTVGQLADTVLEAHPGLVGNASSLVIAVNDEYQDHDYGLSDGDEVALIPPVSGGAQPMTPHPGAILRARWTTRLLQRDTVPTSSSRVWEQYGSVET